MTELQHFEIRNGCQVRTSIINYTYEFSWLIENYSKWPLDKKVTSPDFHPVNDQAFYAILEMRYDAAYTKNMTFLTFYLKSESELEIAIPSIKHTFSITDGSGKKIFSTSPPVNHVYSNSAKKGAFTVFYYETVKGFSDSTDDQSLVFKCTMVFDKFYTESCEIYKIPSQSDNLSDLSGSLKAMYTSSHHADINLQVGDEIVRVHKSLLCARSPVFAKMFESPMEENDKNAIAIPDIELPVLKDFLEFLYTGNFRAEDFESVYSLYYAADKYDVPNLRKTCAGVLLSKMGVENACRVLSLANQHSDVQFKDSAMDLFQFRFDEIVETKAWDEFLEEETKLAVEVMRYRCKKGKPEIKPVA